MRRSHDPFIELGTDDAGARDDTVLRAPCVVRCVPMNIQPLPIKRAYSSGRREQLIAVAAELFLQHSYDAVTVEMIAARAGITGPGLYRHFQNKQAVLIAVLEEPTQIVHEVAKQIAETTKDPKAAMIAMVESHIRLILKGPPSTLIFTKNEHALPEHDHRRIRREMALYAEEWISVIIPLRPDLSEPEARLLTQAVFSMLNTAATLRKGLDEESIFSTMRQAALHALLGRGDL
ncbi:transcriptional regulator, TetR family [Bradyrhizobium erythrophlei]|uniref:Transcriptional regulator, TetR family n=2 Tax=Bradyrhizobium erythrophlei TaxID=1437360 RepID=A0A1H4XD09_9BRAD|nr:transcriptional regulator, TetR family [Bradyrhizobium erythrophlei]